MAAKSTPQIIPMCHPLALNRISITFTIDKDQHTITSLSEVTCHGKTGVEIEALNAVSVAALTIYDMMKWADKGSIISEIKLLHKSGGKSGNFNSK